MRQITQTVAGLLLLAGLVAARADVAATASNDAVMDAEAFADTASEALDVMAKEAEGRGMKGVAVIAFMPDGVPQGWHSRMRVVGGFVQGKSNVLGIAYGKVAEMANTLEDSGLAGRTPLKGEYGYRGGAIRRVPGGHLLAAFSGGSSDDDLAVANLGLDVLDAAERAAAVAR